MNATTKQALKSIYSHKTAIFIGGSRGAVDTHHGPNVFVYMQFSAKIGQIGWEILDPPLIFNRPEFTFVPHLVISSLGRVFCLHDMYICEHLFGIQRLNHKNFHFLYTFTICRSGSGAIFFGNFNKNEFFSPQPLRRILDPQMSQKQPSSNLTNSINSTTNSKTGNLERLPSVNYWNPPEWKLLHLSDALRSQDQVLLDHA